MTVVVYSLNMFGDAVTVKFIAEGLQRLRSLGADDADAYAPINLWRGMRNLRVGDDFASSGGTELAPMSATAEMDVALRYALSPSTLLFKIVTKNFLARGVDLSYLSCFPEEKEHLFSPLTYLAPTAREHQTLAVGETSVTIVEVESTFG